MLTSEIWGPQDSVSSTCIPRHLYESTLSIGWPSRQMSELLGSGEILCQVPMNKHLVLTTLRLRRLESSHCLRLPESRVRDDNNSSGSFDAYVRLVSSAYILTSDGMKCFFRSIDRTAFVKPLSMLKYQLSVISIRALKV